jgi:hypothetical protein
MNKDEKDQKVEKEFFFPHDNEIRSIKAKSNEMKSVAGVGWGEGLALLCSSEYGISRNRNIPLCPCCREYRRILTKNDIADEEEQF